MTTMLLLLALSVKLFRHPCSDIIFNVLVFFLRRCRTPWFDGAEGLFYIIGWSCTSSLRRKGGEGSGGIGLSEIR